MAVIAVIDNAAELAAEIEAKAGLLQAIKEGSLPSYIQTVYGVSPGTSAVEATTTTPAADAEPLVAAQVVPEVPSLVVPTAPTI